MTANELIRLLDLKSHPEGGYYRETYRSDRVLSGLGSPFTGERSASTAIYYLLVPGIVSKAHRLLTEEVFHFYLGDPVTWVLFGPEGRTEKVTMGSLVECGQKPQWIVPAGTWFGGYLNEGGNFALMGTTMAPGFDFRDFRLADRSELLEGYPDAESDVLRLT